MNFQSKKEIRKYISDVRDSMPTDQKAEMDDKIYRTIINSEFYRKSAVIFTFVSFRSEVDTHRFISYALEDKKVICVPKVLSKSEGMEVYIIDSLSDLEEGYFGILEPKIGCIRASIDDIDLVLTPGLAFDREGGRMGYGGGFYDTFLAGLKEGIPKIALAYHFQVISKVPVYELDLPVDGIITDEETIIINM